METNSLSLTMKLCLSLVYVIGVFISPIVWGFLTEDVKRWDEFYVILLHLVWPVIIVGLLFTVILFICFGLPLYLISGLFKELSDIGIHLKVVWDERKSNRKDN